MKHLGTPRLETERLILRPFILEDADPMFANWASDPAVTRYLTWPTHTSPDITRRTLDSWAPRYGDPRYYHWAVELRSLGQPIGSISGVKIDEDTGTVEIGYCIGQPWWGQGMVPEALHALMSFFFEQVGVERIVACHHPDNPNSGRVMRKCGMTFKGTWYQEDKGRELCWYSINREEYCMNNKKH